MILITGGTGYTGRLLLKRLVQSGAIVRCLVRPSSDVSYLRELGVEWAAVDLGAGQLAEHFEGVTHVAHLAPIWHGRAVVSALTETIQQAVFVSSLRRFSRIPSPSVEAVVTGERHVLESGFRCTILRPSMIYGPGEDRNISRLAQRLRRSAWIPVVGSGLHVQQPVHVADVVQAIIAALDSTQARGKTYAIAGPQAVTFNDLIDLVASAVDSTPRKVHIPVYLGLAASWLMKGLGLKAGVDPEQVRRLQEDKVYAIEPARVDLGFDPVPLAVGLQQIYGGA